MTKHTEGPWVVVEHEVWDTRSDGEPGIPLFRRDSNYRRWGRDLKAGEAEANARLIAAAPDLLEVARMVVEASDLAGISGPLGDAARAAITKATPEGRP